MRCKMKKQTTFTDRFSASISKDIHDMHKVLSSMGRETSLLAFITKLKKNGFNLTLKVSDFSSKRMYDFVLKTHKIEIGKKRIDGEWSDTEMTIKSLAFSPSELKLINSKDYSCYYYPNPDLTGEKAFLRSCIDLEETIQTSRMAKRLNQLIFDIVETYKDANIASDNHVYSSVLLEISEKIEKLDNFGDYVSYSTTKSQAIIEEFRIHFNIVLPDCFHYNLANNTHSVFLNVIDIEDKNRDYNKNFEERILHKLEQVSNIHRKTSLAERARKGKFKESEPEEYEEESIYLDYSRPVFHISGSPYVTINSLQRKITKYIKTKSLVIDGCPVFDEINYCSYNETWEGNISSSVFSEVTDILSEVLNKNQCE